MNKSSPKGKYKYLTPEDTLVYRPNRHYRERPIVLRRLLIDIGREYKCELCSISDMWNGQKIVLEVHHIDGDWHNNQATNLQFLCPNCHSQTPTFYNKKAKHYCICGKPKNRGCKGCKSCRDEAFRQRESKRPDKELLESLLSQMPATSIAKQFGVSDKAVEKWCNRYKLAKPPRGYWQKKKALENKATGSIA